MECLYIPEMSESNLNPEIPQEEKKHLKALRIKPDEEILISNGLGLTAIAQIIFDEKWNPSCEIREYISNYGEIEFNFSLWVCNLHHKDRLEMIVEKGTELGASEIFIPICQYSQTDKIDLIRLEKIAIAALKQSRRARKIKITQVNKNINQDEIYNQFSNIILLDENGKNPLTESVQGDTLILVGPEGGFHENEIKKFTEIPHLKKWYLGKRRLRTETAAIKALSIVTSMNE